MAIIEKTCVVCGKKTRTEIPAEAFRRWQEGALIQEVVPDWTPEQRERLISGVCSDECWDTLWGVGEEEDDGA